jgi:radical SAM superfamily enzyme YgiQ (UPF0313 family)
MIGQPFDTKESVADSVNLALELQSYGARVLFSITTPFPGTYMYNRHEELKLKFVETNFDYFNTVYPVYDTDFLSADDIRTLHYDACIEIIRNQKDEWQIEENKNLLKRLGDL